MTLTSDSQLKTIGPYKLLSKIGEGAMGQVYLGYHERLDKKYAIKILPPQLAKTPMLLQRFMKEARQAARLHHPYIVQIINADEAEGHHFIAMEFISGESMYHASQKPDYTIHCGVHHTFQIAQALDYAHNMGVIHRDIKPDNILINEENDAKLTDFGLVREINHEENEERLTKVGTPIGTPHFMSPEQWRNDNVDHLTDIYSLGVTLFYLLSGRYPFEGNDYLEVFANQQQGRLLNLRHANSAIDIRLAKIVHKAIERNREHRYPNAAEFAIALDNWWSQNPTEKRPKIDSMSQCGSNKRTTRASHLPPQASRPTIEPHSFESRGRTGSGAKHSAPNVARSQQRTGSGLIKSDPSNITSSFHRSRSQLSNTQPPSKPRRDHSMKNPSIRGALNSDFLKPVRIAENTYWVGKRQPGAVFFANPYLRVFEGKDANGNKQRYSILIDPGSNSDFAVIRSKVSAIIGSLSQISILFINHQDPDVCSSANVILGRFAKRSLVLTSEETWRLIVHLGLPRDRCIFTEKYPDGFRLRTGHKLQLVPTPFCHFVGAVMLYDPETRVLFSGDLCGGLTPRDAEGFLADESDWTGVRAFHQLYMPSNTAIRAAVKTIRALNPPVEMIAPQHGRLLRGEIMHKFLDRLEELPVGLDNIEERSNDAETLPGWNSVLQRVIAMARENFGEEIIDTVREDPLLKDDLIENQGEFSIKEMGKSTLERVVRALVAELPTTMANMIQYEAIAAAEDFHLPVPKLSIEEIHHNNNDIAGIMDYSENIDDSIVVL